MFSNFTEESCTGTGDVLTLTGATSGMLPFSASFSDGELISYALEDSGGVIKIAGVGTYNAVNNTITRNDTWNWNGTAVDKNPATNIALSGGTHTVRCDVTLSSVNTSAELVLTQPNINHRVLPDNWSSTNWSNQHVRVANEVIFIPVFYNSSVRFNSLQVDVDTVSATAIAGIGLYTCDNQGLPLNLIDQVLLDVTTTGLKFAMLSKEFVLPPGRYFSAITCTDLVAKFRSVDVMTHAGRAGGYQFRQYKSSGLRTIGMNITNGVLPNSLSGMSFDGIDPLAAVAVSPRLT